MRRGEFTTLERSFLVDERRGIVADGALAICASNMDGLPRKLDAFQELADAFQARLDLGHVERAEQTQSQTRADGVESRERVAQEAAGRNALTERGNRCLAMVVAPCRRRSAGLVPAATSKSVGCR